MDLISFLGEDKAAWGQISALIGRMDSERVFLVQDRKTSGFPKTSKCEDILIESSKPLLELKEDIFLKLKAKLKGDFEVAVSIASGNGKEHMALISALLSIPVGIRFVVFTKKGIEYIN